jgi:Ca2+-binding RTX toxin-like protein
MKSVHQVAVTALVAALTLTPAAPGHAAVDAGLMCLGKPATIVGTHGPDFLVGGPEDVVVGLAGDDWLFGGTVCAGPGNDNVNGPELWANTKLDGGDGNDQLMGGFRVDLLLGGAGNDYLWDTDDQDNPDCSDPGTDVMKGGPGDDRFVSSAGRNIIYGDQGDDQVLDYSHVRTVISAGPGRDTIDATRDNQGLNPYEPDTINGDAGKDTAKVNPTDKVSSAESVTYVPQGLPQGDHGCFAQ